MLMPSRTYQAPSTDDYRFGFQGQEGDDEVKGEGNSVEYKYRRHDPRLGRFLIIDPLASKFAYNSPYAFSENRLIDAIELEGLEKVDVDKKSDPYFTIAGGGKSTWDGGTSVNSGKLQLNPGEVNVTISLEYILVTSEGVSSLDFDANQFNESYGWGNTSFRSDIIPGQGLVSERSNGAYNINVSYDFTASRKGSFEEAMNWMKSDIQRRGMMLGIESDRWSLNTDAGLIESGSFSFDIIRRFTGSDNFWAGTSPEAVLIQNLVGASNEFRGDNETGGYGNATSIYNYIIFNKAKTAWMSTTMVAVHEGGHNLSRNHLHGTGDYEYNQDGLSSNELPYPVLKNTINILNELWNY